MEEYRFTGGRLTVWVKAQGAELSSLVDERFGEMLWSAGAVWPAHAPNLFPIVGQLANDTLHVAGVDYQLPRHGFARRRRFEWIDRGPQSCALELQSDAQTREVYPFAFSLRIAYAVDDRTLTVTYRVRNTGDRTLPASIGAHPAFRWPLVAGIPKEAHTLTFAVPEPAPVRRLTEGLLATREFPTPIEGRTLRLEEGLFADDAIVMDRLASHAVRYTAPGAPTVDVAWERFEQLGVWSKPGGDFVCIEPWYGYASPVDFDGPFEQKPGLLHLPPGAEETLRLHIRVGDDR